MVFWVNLSSFSPSMWQGWWQWSSETPEWHVQVVFLIIQSPISLHHPGTTSYCGHTQTQFWFQQVCLSLASTDTKPVCIQALFFSNYFANISKKPLNLGFFPIFFVFPVTFRRYGGYFWAILSSFLYFCVVLLNTNAVFYVSCSLAQWLKSNAMKTLWSIKLMMQVAFQIVDRDSLWENSSQEATFVGSYFIPVA